MLSFIMPSDIAHSVVMPNVIMLTC
jgi:hypothetical protein